jgi:hypothetical protein
MTAMLGPVHSLAWDPRRKFLVVGGNMVLNIYRVDMAEARHLSHAQVMFAFSAFFLADSGQIPLFYLKICHKYLNL